MRCRSDDLPSITAGRGMMQAAADDEISRLLAEREAMHGPHHRTALFEQSMRDTMRNVYSECWQELPPAIRSALDEIVRKMARILSGDHTHEDHWRDIEGAARLGLQEAERERDYREWLERLEQSGGEENG